MNSKKVELYSQIENLIINWNNDGNETAGHLTRQIMELLKSDEIDTDDKNKSEN